MKRALARATKRPVLPLRGRGIPILLLTALLSGCAAPKPQPPVLFETEPWTFASAPGFKLTTAHYEIYTTLRDQVLRDALPGFVEAAYENYARLIPPSRADAGRMKVYLLASRGQFEAFTRRFTGPRAKVFLQVHNGGYSERGVSVIEYVAHDITFPLFAHEGFHQYLYHYVNARVPAWLNEGLAVYCEGQRWDAQGIKEFDPWFNPMRRNDLVAGLAGNHLHPLRRLLETDAGRIIRGNDQSIASYYGQVWALMLFLQNGANGKYAPGFHRLLGSLSTPGPGPSALRPGESLFRSFISDDLDTVEREYLEFVRTRFLGRG
jgi:hypothetical protein